MQHIEVMSATLRPASGHPPNRGDHLGYLFAIERVEFLFDDIKELNMLGTWRAITRPKLDITSFGHWTGTGLVHWVS